MSIDAENDDPNLRLALLDGRNAEIRFLKIIVIASPNVLHKI